MAIMNYFWRGIRQWVIEVKAVYKIVDRYFYIW